MTFNLRTGPGMQTHNVSRTKRFRLTERIALDYMAEPRYAAWPLRRGQQRPALHRYAAASGALTFSYE
jgi:hypothetical protein